MPSKIEAAEMLAIVGLPRSGTTLLTALLDAHSKVGLYYEPWNAFPAQPPPEPPQDLPQFIQNMEERFKIKLPTETRIVGFKETTTHMGAMEWSEATLESLARTVPCRVIWIFRNPIHCYLSRIEGAREWWGVPDASVNEKSFISFLHETGPALVSLRRITEQNRGIFLPYETLVADPALHLSDLMSRLGLKSEPDQLDYHTKPTMPGKVMGDPRLQKNPRPVSEERLSERTREARTHEEMLERVLAEDPFAWIRGQFEELSSHSEVANMSATTKLTEHEAELAD